MSRAKRARRRAAAEPPSTRAGATRHEVAVASAGARAALGAARVDALVRGVLRAERVGAATVSVTFLGARAMARLNREQLGHAGATDVISFGFARTGPEGVVGDIYVCPDVARANAAHFGCGGREETARLVIHGVLHVLGHDHPEGEARTASPMWRRQEALLRRLRAAWSGA